MPWEGENPMGDHVGLDYHARVTALKNHIESRDIDAAVLFDRGNVRYLTGWRQNTSSTSVAVITPDTIRYLVPGLDEAAVKDECWIPSESVFVFPDDGDPIDVVIESLGSASARGGANIDRIGVEPRTITAHRLTKLERDLGAETVAIDDVLETARAVKTERERTLYRQAGAVTSDVMRTVLADAAPGTRECDLTARAWASLLEHGGEGASFEPFAMAGEHASMPHRTATTRRIGEGELVVFDMGLEWDGYATDITRTFSFGEPSSEQRRLFEAARNAHRASVEAVAPGVEARAVHEVATDVLAEFDLDDYFPHLTGHGLGYDIHEAPLIDVGVDDTLEAGMVVTIEPGVYKSGVGGARIEDMVLVTDDGHELLTDVRRELVPLPNDGFDG